jgi:hypothetical protein
MHHYEGKRLASLFEIAHNLLSVLRELPDEVTAEHGEGQSIRSLREGAGLEVLHTLVRAVDGRRVRAVGGPYNMEDHAQLESANFQSAKPRAGWIVRLGRAGACEAEQEHQEKELTLHKFMIHRI